MSETRYNENFNTPANSQYGNSNIEKYLKKEIDFLLAPSADQLNSVEYNDIYIPVPLAENFLSSAMSCSLADKVFYLTGLTGSGKSMILRNVFQYHGMSPEIKYQTLVIPFSFDNFSSNRNNTDENDNGIENVYVNMLNSACELIENTYPHLKLITGNEDDFLRTVNTSRGDFTQVPYVWPRPNSNDRMMYFMKKHPIPFHTAMLKYYLNQNNCPINNIVLLIDDIEGVGESQELIPIKLAYRIITCLENTPKSKHWSVHLIISCRNYVYRLIMDNSFTAERQQIETYTESEDFHLEKSPTIAAIVNKRYQAISKKDKSEKWKTALDTVMAILVGIDSSIGEFILNLKIRNIRKALSVTKRIVYNKQWIQRDYTEDSAGAFTIDSVKDYDITPATLIRAIGMRESLVYCSNISDIPNVMYNENDTDLYPLLVLKYCLNCTNKKYANWNDTISLTTFYNKLEYIFGNEENSHIHYFKVATEYLIINRLLLRSIDQLQANAMPVNETNVGEINRVYISNAAVDIWDLLGKNSVLMEMYMDDIWMDNSIRPISKRKFRGFDSDNFSIAIKYINTLIDKETIIRNHARNLGKFNEYEKLFGSELICQHLLDGLSKSLNAFYKEDAEEQKSIYEITEIYSKIKNFNRNNLLIK